MGGLDELDVVIRRKNGRVVAGIPAVGLYATADSAAAALDALEVKKNDFRADLAEAGQPEPQSNVESQAVEPAAARAKPGELRMVALKTLIVVGVITAALLVVGGLVAAKVDDTIDKAVYSIRTQLAPIANAKIGGAQFWSKVEAEFDRAANERNDLPPEKQAKLLANIRVLVNRARPFVAEVAPLFADLHSPAGQASGQSCK